MDATVKRLVSAFSRQAVHLMKGHEAMTRLNPALLSQNHLQLLRLEVVLQGGNFK